MKEKTADIDILEELKPEKMDLIQLIRTFKREGIENFITIRREKFETLIAENKELKEENEGLKTKLDTLIEKHKDLKEMLKHRIEYTNKLEEDLFQNASNYVIPKSKVKAKIEIRKEEKANCKDSIEEKYLLREIYVLQSLLGKE